ncbi:MAG TPA: hypothetical protein VE010_07080 [Thermoanaerobaculia bacterium]|nr:hypothetical protein [Thermoanaerobaculia bacterium]
MYRQARSLAALAALLLAACTTTTPIPSAAPSVAGVAVLGTAQEEQTFAGTWRGSVRFTDARLNDEVEFRVVPRSNEQEAYVVAAGGDDHAPRLLYVRLDGARLHSAAAPVSDADCRCTVYTTLSGQLDGDTISGEVRRLENRTRVLVGTFTFSRVADQQTAQQHGLAAGRRP